MLIDTLRTQLNHIKDSTNEIVGIIANMTSYLNMLDQRKVTRELEQLYEASVKVLPISNTEDIS